MTSMMPSGTPGNSRSRPRAYEMMIGSAIRNPRIQPGRGSVRADSMIEGRTKVIGSFPAHCSTSTRSPMALVKG